MTFKLLQNSKGVYICDICGCEFEYDKNGVSINIEQTWIRIFKIKHFDICKKHRKEIIHFMK